MADAETPSLFQPSRKGMASICFCSRKCLRFPVSHVRRKRKRINASTNTRDKEQELFYSLRLCLRLRYGQFTRYACTFSVARVNESSVS